MARCLYPCSDCEHNKTASKLVEAKTECAHLAFNAMVATSSGAEGVLVAAMQTAALYGHLTDQLLSPRHPIYGNTLFEKFKINPAGPKKQVKSTVHRFLTTEVQSDDRGKYCVSLLAQHRAFELMFTRYASAIKAYTQTFGRDLQSEGWFRIAHSCRKLFYVPVVGLSSLQQSCKHENFECGKASTDLFQQGKCREAGKPIPMRDTCHKKAARSTGASRTYRSRTRSTRSGSKKNGGRDSSRRNTM